MSNPVDSKKPIHEDVDRFRAAEKYAAYLETVEGRLRMELAFANLQEFLPQASMRVLDLGCGPGTTAVGLAGLGHQVTLLDSSLAMLDLAKDAAKQAGVADKIDFKHGDAAQLPDLIQNKSFDVIICHNVLEYVDDPVATLWFASRAMRSRTAFMSVLVRNRLGEVMKAAIQTGDLAAADGNLTAEWGHESLYGGKVRLFSAERMHAMLRTASLEMVAERGVRVMSDYLPSQISRVNEYARILELERKLGRMPQFTAIARYAQFIVRRADLLGEDGA